MKNLAMSCAVNVDNSIVVLKFVAGQRYLRKITKKNIEKLHSMFYMWWCLNLDYLINEERLSGATSRQLRYDCNSFGHSLYSLGTPDLIELKLNIF